MNLTLNDLTPVQLLVVSYALAHTQEVMDLVPPGKESALLVEPDEAGITPPAKQRGRPRKGRAEVDTDTGPGQTPEASLFEGHPSAEQVFGGRPAEAPPSEGTQVFGGRPAEAPSSEGTQDLDSEGYPWDARIHAGSRTLLKNGTWRIKPKVDMVSVSDVRGEYRRLGFGPSHDEDQPAATLPAATLPAATPVDYPALLNAITRGIAGKKFTPQQVSQVLGAHGISTTGELATFEHLFEEINEELTALSV